MARKNFLGCSDLKKKLYSSKMYARKYQPLSFEQNNVMTF